MGNNSERSLYRFHELAIRTLYSELKERVSATKTLLPGTPGTLVKRSGTGHEYWYRSYYPFPKKRKEDFVGAISDDAAHDEMQSRIAFSEWTSKQVLMLAKLGYQVADKGVASVLVELHNRGTLQAGLVLVGTLAYMTWLNEFGAMAIAGRTQDIDLARRQKLQLGAPISFLGTVQATQLPFVKVPGMPSHAPSTSVKMPGAEGLRIDLLAPGPCLGDIISVPELEWHAQTIPFFEYMLQNGRPAAILAGRHCVPIVLPEPTRLVWHKLYASAQRSRDPGKSEKDLVQAVTLAAVMVEQDNLNLRDSFLEAPREVRAAARSRLSRIEGLLAQHAQALDEFRNLASL